MGLMWYLLPSTHFCLECMESVYVCACVGLLYIMQQYMYY